MKKPDTTGIPERLEAVKRYLSLTDAALARECGASKQNVNSWKRGAIPKVEKIRPLLLKHGINPMWVLFGDGTMLDPWETMPKINRKIFELLAQMDRDEAQAALVALEAFLRTFVVGKP